MSLMNELIEQTTENMEETLPNAEEFVSDLNIPVGHIVLALVVILVIGLLFFLINRKHRYSKKDLFKQEISQYKGSFGEYFEPTKRVAGNVSIMGGKVIFTRGNKTVAFDIPIERITYISPSKIAPWFEGRNYNQNEEQIIMENIREYLITNRCCSKVIFKEDEEDELEM